MHWIPARHEKWIYHHLGNLLCEFKKRWSQFIDIERKIMTSMGWERYWLLRVSCGRLSLELVQVSGIFTRVRVTGTQTSSTLSVRTFKICALCESSINLKATMTKGDDSKCWPQASRLELFFFFWKQWLVHDFQEGKCESVTSREISLSISGLKLRYKDKHWNDAKMWSMRSL